MKTRAVRPGPRERAIEATRTCAGCRRRGVRRDLVRFTLDETGRVQLDSRAVMRGRGAWVCPRIDCLRAASGRGGFNRSFRRSTESGPLAVVQDHVGDALAKDLADLESRRGRSILAGGTLEGPYAQKLERARKQLLSWTAERTVGESSSRTTVREREGL